MQILIEKIFHFFLLFNCAYAFSIDYAALAEKERACYNIAELIKTRENCISARNTSLALCGGAFIFCFLARHEHFFEFFGRIIFMCTAADVAYNQIRVYLLNNRIKAYNAILRG